MLGVHIVDYTMPLLGYQDFLLPKKMQDLGNSTVILTSDRYTPISNYESSWEPIMGPRVCGKGDFYCDGLLIKRLEPVYEVQRRIKLRGLYTELVNLKPQYIFVHNILSMNIPSAIKYARKYEIPLFIDSHLTHTSTNKSFAGRIYYMIMRKYYQKNRKHVSGFYGVAEECRDHMHQYLGISRELSKLLPIGIDEKIFQFNLAHRKKKRRELNVSDDQILLMQTGKLCSEKGVHLLTATIGMLSAEKRKRLKIVFVGDGDKDYLRQAVIEPFRAIGFDSYKITGFVDYRVLPEYFSAADIVVYPKASSLSALEAASCRNVVIMSDTDASKWRAKKGVGLSQNFANALETSSVLNSFLEADSIELEKIKLLAAEAVHNEFSYESVVKLLLNDINFCRNESTS